MATKLPGVLDLGDTPRADPTRPVGSYDASGFARGAAALTEGGRQLGAGIVKAGEGYGELQLDKSRWELAKANSFVHSGIIDRESATGADTNYAADDTGKSLVNRHAEAVWDVRDQAAEMISDPRMRERFQVEVAPTIAKSIEKARGHATALENNADLAYVGEQGDNTIDKAIAAPDDETRRQLVDSHNQLIDGLVAKGAKTPVEARSMKQDWAHRYATADLLARSDTDPDGVINELRAAPGSNADVTGRILRIEGQGKNPRSSATGAGQFIDSTWLDVLKRNRPDLAQGRSDQEVLALRADKALGRDMTDAYRRENEATLRKQGIETTPGAQYLAHFLGPGGAAAVLKADPDQPVADALAKAVGPAKAKAMVDANPSILRGKLVGSVTAWSDAKMGGQAPGGGSIYDFLRPDVREQILSNAIAARDKRSVDGRAEFAGRVADATAEAMNTGAVTQPIAPDEFIATYGADDGPRRFAQYDTQVQTGRAIAAMATMPPDDRQAVVDGLMPKPGDDNYALKAKAYQVARDAKQNVDQAIAKDPAGYAASRLPASREAFQAFQDAAPIDDAARTAAARKYAATTLLEQGRVGIRPDQQRVVPAAYATSISEAFQKAADADDPKARTGLIGQVQREATMWGEYWPQVMRQMSDKVQPAARAIAAGADPAAMTRLLSLGKDENPGKLLKEQNETKFKDVTTALNTEMAPYLQTLVGRQRDRDFTPYYDMATKLAALYVRDGDPAEKAAQKAFGALIGNRYEFRDTWRMPKSAGVAADDVQAGAQDARAALGRGAQIESNLPAAKAELGLTPQEEALYQLHLKNLTGPGGVDNADGSRSSLFQSSFEIGGKTYNVPTVWDGKILPPNEALKRARAEGLEKFPSYASEGEAEARYQKMHAYMDKDTAQFLKARRADPLLDVRPPVDDMPGRSAGASASDLDLVARDGQWVTAPDNGGLNLVYGDKFVKRADGAPLFLSWADLAKRGQLAPMDVQPGIAP